MVILKWPILHEWPIYVKTNTGITNSNCSWWSIAHSCWMSNCSCMINRSFLMNDQFGVGPSWELYPRMTILHEHYCFQYVSSIFWSYIVLHYCNISLCGRNIQNNCSCCKRTVTQQIRDSVTAHSSPGPVILTGHIGAPNLWVGIDIPESEKPVRLSNPRA